MGAHDPVLNRRDGGFPEEVVDKLRQVHQQREQQRPKVWVERRRKGKC